MSVLPLQWVVAYLLQSILTRGTIIEISPVIVMSKEEAKATRSDAITRLYIRMGTEK